MFSINRFDGFKKAIEERYWPFSLFRLYTYGVDVAAPRPARSDKQRLQFNGDSKQFQCFTCDIFNVEPEMFLIAPHELPNGPSCHARPPWCQTAPLRVRKLPLSSPVYQSFHSSIAALTKASQFACDQQVL